MATNKKPLKFNLNELHRLVGEALVSRRRLSVNDGYLRIPGVTGLEIKGIVMGQNKLTYTLITQPNNTVRSLSDLAAHHGMQLIVRERSKTVWENQPDFRYYAVMEWGDEGDQLYFRGGDCVRGITADGPTPLVAIDNYRRALCGGKVVMVPDLTSGEEFGEDLIALELPPILLEEEAFQTESQS